MLLVVLFIKKLIICSFYMGVEQVNFFLEYTTRSSLGPQVLIRTSH